MSHRTYVNNAYNRSLGRVGMAHGSAVVSRSSSSAASSLSAGSSSGTSCSSRTYVDNAYNRSLGRVGLEHGTAVVSKSASNSSASTSSAASTSAPKTYVDNYQNRKLGRVGEVVGTHVVSQSSNGSVASSSSMSAASSVLKETTYVDNAYNRRLGRVGKPKGSHVVRGNGKASERKRKTEAAIESYPLSNEFEGLSIAEPPLYDVEEDAIASHAARILRLEDLEERWRKQEIVPQTDASKIIALPNCISKDELEDLRLIGRGSFGIVYAALWKTTKTPVAYKQFVSQSITKKKQQSFVKEIELFSKLDHRNIVKMFGAVLEEKHFGILMEYCKKTLFDALFVYTEDNFTTSDRLRIVSEVGSALEYLHTHEPPIAHCDVKSQNILLDSKGTVKVCDFGLSVIKNTIHSSQSTRGEGDAPPGQGTPRYSAPEVLRGELLKLEGLVLADIYSLSLVLFEVIVEEEPYEMLSPKQLATNVGYGDLRPSLEDVQNSDLKVLLQKCWSKIPQERPDIKQFNKEWAKIKEL